MSKARDKAMIAAEECAKKGKFTPVPYLMVRAIVRQDGDYVDPNDYAGFGHYCTFDPMERGDVCVMEVESSYTSVRYTTVRNTLFIVVECESTGASRAWRAIGGSRAWKCRQGLLPRDVRLYRIPFKWQYYARLAADTYNSRDELEAAMRGAKEQSTFTAAQL